jgi:predicted nucleic acid-binding protein
MLAIDTNVVIRYLTGDHPQQSARAKALIEGSDVFVATSVLLETEWVLRSVYGFSTSSMAEALVAFCGLPRVTLEDASLAARALGWLTKGLDFADALHLACADGCDALVSFDKNFAKAANALGGVKVQAL